MCPLNSAAVLKQFDLAMKLKWKELRKQERNNTQVNEITEGDLIQAFGVTEDQMEKAAAMLGRSEKTEKSEVCRPDYIRITEVRTQATVQKKKRYFL